MFDYEYIRTELKDYFTSNTNSVMPYRQQGELCRAFKNRFPNIEPKEDYNAIDASDFQDFIREFRESKHGMTLLTLEDGEADGTGLIPQYKTSDGDYYHEDDDFQLHKVAKNINGKWAKAVKFTRGIIVATQEIPVDRLADETIRAYDRIPSWVGMIFRFAHINSETKKIAEAIYKREEDYKKAVKQAKPGEDPEALYYSDLVIPRDEYLRNADLETLIKAYQTAFDSDFCKHEYIPDDEQEGNDDDEI